MNIKIHYYIKWYHEYSIQCQVHPEKSKIDLTKKICLVLGISNESASITNGIAKTLSQAGAKVYIAPSQNNKSAKKWPEIEQPYRNENVITIKGLYFKKIFNDKKNLNYDRELRTVFW